MVMKKLPYGISNYEEVIEDKAEGIQENRTRNRRELFRNSSIKALEGKIDKIIEHINI